MRLKLFFTSILLAGTFAALGTHTDAKAVLAIEPTHIELALKPGQTVNNKLRVGNQGDKPITVELSTQAFNVINEQYDFRFSNAEELRKWLRFEKDFVEIQPGKSVFVNYELAIPQNAEPGGRYLALFASVIKNEDSSNIYPRAGQMLYLTVGGDFKQAGQLVDFMVPKIVFNRNLSWSYRVRNTGTVHFYSPITISINNIFGRQVNSGQNRHLIMPNSTRLINSVDQLSAWPGIYRLKADIAVPDRAVPTITRTLLFLPIPFLLLVTFICYGVYRGAKRLKRTKDSVPPQ